MSSDNGSDNNDDNRLMTFDEYWDVENVETPDRFLKLASSLLRMHLKEHYPSALVYPPSYESPDMEETWGPPPLDIQQKIASYLGPVSFEDRFWSEESFTRDHPLTPSLHPYFEAAFPSATWPKARYIYYKWGVCMGHINDYDCMCCGMKWGFSFTGPCPCCPVAYEPLIPETRIRDAWAHLRRHARAVDTLARFVRSLFDQIYYKPGGRGFLLGRQSFEDAARLLPDTS